MHVLTKSYVPRLSQPTHITQTHTATQAYIPTCQTQHTDTFVKIVTHTTTVTHIMVTHIHTETQTHNYTQVYPQDAHQFSPTITNHRHTLTETHNHRTRFIISADTETYKHTVTQCHAETETYPGMQTHAPAQLSQSHTSDTKAHSHTDKH